MRPIHLAALALAGSAAAGHAATQDDCTALRNAVLPAGFVTSARVVPAADTLPAYCEVRATALPAISIEVRLPMEGWNGHYYQAGCGGFCGILGRADAGAGWINAMRPGLERGYATATSDSGHHGLSVLDAAWADHNPQAERDWGWRSIGETNRVDTTYRDGAVTVGHAILQTDSPGLTDGQAVVMVIRPEDVLPHAAGHEAEPRPNHLPVVIGDMEFLGSYWRAHLSSPELGRTPLVANFSINAVRRFDLDIGTKLTVELPSERLLVFPREGA